MTAGAVHPLRLAREVCGLTRPELAHRVGCSARTIEAIEQSEFEPSAAMADRIERALLRSAVAHIADVEHAVAACARLDAAAVNGSEVRA